MAGGSPDTGSPAYRSRRRRARHARSLHLQSPPHLIDLATSPPSVTAAQLLVGAAAATVAGIVNAIAGGGTLLTFPSLVAAGLSPLSANATSTVALLPGA